MSKPYAQWLAEDCGYTHIRPLPGGTHYAAIMRLAFTHAIIVGRVGDVYSHENRWCYRTEALAVAALNAWDGTGEPTGWHRHPGTGRRVDDNGVMTTDDDPRAVRTPRRSYG